MPPKAMESIVGADNLTKMASPQEARLPKQACLL